MRQRLSPLIPAGSSQFNGTLSVVRENGDWTYFLGNWPVFQHAEQDRRSFRTYHKHPHEDWPETEFTPTEIRLAQGEVVTHQLAERGSWVGSRKDGLWMRAIRKLNPSGHQTSLISTDYGTTSPQDAGRLFSRWSQENFFGYAMEHIGIDLLSEYGTEEIPETKKPINDIRVAVGTAVVGGLPHRSVRAELPHMAPPLDDEDQSRTLISTASRTIF